jgi:hypothetical protein
MIYDVEQLVRCAECGILGEFIEKNNTDVNLVVNQIVSYYEDALEDACCRLIEEKETDE